VLCSKCCSWQGLPPSVVVAVRSAAAAAARGLGSCLVAGQGLVEMIHRTTVQQQHQQFGCCVAPAGQCLRAGTEHLQQHRGGGSSWVVSCSWVLQLNRAASLPKAGRQVSCSSCCMMTRPPRQDISDVCCKICTAAPAAAAAAAAVAARATSGSITNCSTLWKFHMCDVGS
jgi:hypothetical protein